MKVKFIGTGGIGCKERAYTSLLIDNLILFDIGNGIMQRLRDYQVDLGNIEYIVISHYHNDHFADIVDYLITKDTLEIDKVVTIIGPSDIKQKVSDFLMFLEPTFESNKVENIEDSYKVKFIGLDNDEYSDENIKIKDYDLVHGTTNPNKGYLLNYNNHSIALTGDTAKCDNLELLVNDAETIMIDCSYYKSKTWHIGLDYVCELTLDNPQKNFYAVHRKDYEVQCDVDNLFFPNDGDEIEIGD